MDTSKQNMLIDGANPSMLWYNIAEYIGNLSKSMVKTYNQRQRSNKPITWGELDKVNQDLHHQLDIIITGDRNVKTISEERKMNKKQTIRLNEADFHRIVKQAVKNVLNEQYGVDFDDTLAWVKRKKPDMPPQEQEMFARNIIRKKQKQNTPKPETFNSLKELLKYYDANLRWYRYDVPEYDRSGWDERYIATANIPSRLNGTHFLTDLVEFIQNHEVRLFGNIVEDIIENGGGQLIALSDL